ncbi:ATP-grasp domain-containing protein [Jannaschia sp. LMIT008]|uniref:ATP-grasp domain-containing protein n=1 Tax=Jannaschia maritima TaxID=3032585 RepID=UPI002811E404|nr:ATP-grasp domain-containing protein [Jannaschia sp. LMIT008]
MIPQAVAATFPENWPHTLRALAVPTRSRALSNDDAWALGAYSDWFRDATGAVPRPFGEDLLDWIDATMAGMPEGVSPRIGMCSWKDASPSHLPSFGRRGVLHTMTSDSPRIGRAVAAHLAGGPPVHLHLRAWRRFGDEGEFRAFVSDGRVVGVSQYHHRRTFPALLDRRDDLLGSLRRSLRRIVPMLHVESCAVDLHLGDDGEATLIEINPFDRATDACLFSWSRPNDFDRSLRLRDGDGVVRILP